MPTCRVECKIFPRLPISPSLHSRVKQHAFSGVEVVRMVFSGWSDGLGWVREVTLPPTNKGAQVINNKGLERDKEGRRGGGRREGGRASRLDRRAAGPVRIEHRIHPTKHTIRLPPPLLRGGGGDFVFVIFCLDAKRFHPSRKRVGVVLVRVAKPGNPCVYLLALVGGCLLLV